MSRDKRTLIGVGALACAACCIGPILAILGAIGVASVVGIALFGTVGAAIALLAVPVYLRQRRRNTCPTDPPETVRVPSPTIKAPR